MLTFFLVTLVWRVFFAKKQHPHNNNSNTTTTTTATTPTTMTDNNKDDDIAAILDKSRPVALNVTFGTAMGFCSGLALKKTGKAVAYLVGITFVAVQIAVAFGYIAVDWKKIENDTIKKLDQTGDGRLDVEDAKKIWATVRTLLTKNLPSAGGFSLGFLYGARIG